jgi:hypothetical protein
MTVHPHMANSRRSRSGSGDPNYVSTWFWLLTIAVTAIPCVGWIMIVVWAVFGENETRKNYFKALLIWILFWVVLYFLLTLFGVLPAVLLEFKEWWEWRSKGS